jgi:hypothetical protein
MTAAECMAMAESRAADWEREAFRWADGDQDDRKFGRRCQAIADEIRRLANDIRGQLEREAEGAEATV